MLHLDDQTRVSVAGILRTATDVDGGRTPEQERFVAALTEHVLRVAPNDIPVVTVSDWSTVTPQFLEAEWTRLESQSFDVAPLYLPHWYDVILEAVGM